ncbi:MAG: choice-of-anchor D domain-containing protein, partial [Bryocella sp.]
PPVVTKPVNHAIDPNGKLTSGFGDFGFIPVGSPITYTVYFENQPTATAPAVQVTVTDQLPSNLDLSTIQFNQIAFNDVTLTLPSGAQTFSAQALVSTDANPVNVSATLNPTTGLLTFVMQSVDPLTGTFPANPTAGFLPPNNAANSGVGSVTFTVMPKSGLANAATITNVASIVFDANAAIATNSVTNTIDSTTPVSAISPLPSTTTSSSFPVSWTGSDPSGSGIASYNIYVSLNSGPYLLWLSGTPLTTSTYAGTPGNSYSFFSLATNNTGVAQSLAATPQSITVTYLPPTVTVTPALSAITSAQSLTVSIGVAASGTTVPTGSVVLSSGTYASAPVALVSGSASVLIPAGALANGLDTLTVTYTPDTAGSSTFSTATGIATVTVGTGTTTTQVMIGASPAGETFSVDGTNYTTTQSFTWTVGTQHTLATTALQSANGVQKTFTTWSDGGALSHTVTAAAGTTAYTASFSSSYLLTVGAAPVAGGSVTPVSGTYYLAGTVVNLAATPATGYTFASWTGAVANSASASTTVAMNMAQTVTVNFNVILAPIVSITPATLTFSSVSGVKTAAQTVQLSNTGNGPLTITGITIGGTGVADFAQTNTCGTSVAANTNCLISVTFTPASVASFSATLSIADNGSGSPQTVSLAGTGTSAAPPATFTVTATPPSLIVSGGKNAIYTISVNPQGGTYSGVVLLSATGLPPGSTATFAPSSVTPGAAAAQSTLTISTVGLRSALQKPNGPSGVPMLAFLGCLLLMVRKRRRIALYCLLAIASLATVTSLTGCGSTPITAAFTVTVTGTSGTQVQSTTILLTVK